MWDPGTYARYAGERARPLTELLSRVGAASPRAVVDLGCGTGELTGLLRERWPHARLTGIDSSAEMLPASTPDITYLRGDVRDFMPAPDVDVLVSNATLQWVAVHDQLVVRWAGDLGPDAWLAFSVPGNFQAPSHVAIRELAAARGLGHLVRPPDAVLEPAEYVTMLQTTGCTVDAWETTYLHELAATGPDHPVLAWVEGTALRPVRAELADGDWAAFRSELAERLAAAYPVRDGHAVFPFRRLFVVAHTPS